MLLRTAVRINLSIDLIVRCIVWRRCLCNGKPHLRVKSLLLMKVPMMVLCKITMRNFRDSGLVFVWANVRIWGSSDVSSGLNKDFD